MIWAQMAGKFWLAMAISIAAAVNAEEPDLAKVVASPYELSRYIASQPRFEWKPILKALHYTDGVDFLPRCDWEASDEGPSCTSELITVTDPFQIIVVVEDKQSSRFQAYLRYRRNAQGKWNFAGIYAPWVKYFRPEHRVLTYGAKTFLTVTRQGLAGTGMSGKIENWFDLTSSRFEPVLQFTSEGERNPAPVLLDCRVLGFVQQVEMQPVERVTVGMSIEFRAPGDGDDGERICARSDTLAYTRTGTGNFTLDQNQSTATPAQLRRFYDDLEGDQSPTAFLSFTFKELLKAAQGTDPAPKAWLSKFLRRCPNTPEAQQLKQALAKSTRAH
jgi:hypothetical protein